MIKTYKREPKKPYLDTNKTETTRVPVLPATLEAEYSFNNVHHTFSYVDAENIQRTCAYPKTDSLYDACRAFVRRIADKGKLVLRTHDSDIVDQLHPNTFGEDVTPDKTLTIDGRVLEIEAIKKVA